MKGNVTRLLLPIFCCILLTALSACGSGGSGSSSTDNGTSASPTAPSGHTPIITGAGGGNQNGTTQHVPATQTSCPAAGTGRAMVSANLVLGAHNNLVYVVNEYTDSTDATPTAGTLKRYDTSTGTRTVLVGIPHESIDSAQVSADGKWVLFATSNGELRLVRMDGQGLQTLFCAAGEGPNDPQWSTDQQHIIFSVNEVGNHEAVYVLTVATGQLQNVLSISTNGAGLGVRVNTWLDNHRVYLTNYAIDQPHDKIYILDINNGAHQDVSSLPALVNHTFGDFDSSYDGRHLFVDYGYCGQGGCLPPSHITVQPATGGAQTTILNEPNYDVTTVRAVSAVTLLVIINNNQAGGGGDSSRNGLWKVHPDGTNMTRLTTDSSIQFSSLNSFSQYPWSNVARDNQFYATQVLTNSHGSLTYTLEYGNVLGGAPTQIASIGGNTTLALAGWTTM